MAAPLWNKVSPQCKTAWDDFFLRTDNTHLPSLRNLDHITRLATNIISVLSIVNPFGDNLREPAAGWYLDQLSLVKGRLACAIAHKRDYYDETNWGVITKLFLRLFCLWNNGDTACIRRAEELLFRYDSRYPIARHGKEMGSIEFSFGRLAINKEWVQELLQGRYFYNYNPNRAIEVYGGNNQTMPRFMVAVRRISWRKLNGL